MFFGAKFEGLYTKEATQRKQIQLDENCPLAKLIKEMNLTDEEWEKKIKEADKSPFSL